MRLEKASHKAIVYACMNFHYAKSIPASIVSYSVFNNIGEWCGVICYGLGANNNMSKTYNLKQGQVLELVRMALNGKQESTTKAMAISIKLLKKNAPLVKLIVSYADYEQGHLGTIYQATNWIYTGYSTDRCIIVNGKKMHKRTISDKYGNRQVDKLRQMGLKIEVKKTQPKFKYIYPIDKSLIQYCNTLKKPYPKKYADIA